MRHHSITFGLSFVLTLAIGGVGLPLTPCQAQGWQLSPIYVDNQLQAGLNDGSDWLNACRDLAGISALDNALSIAANDQRIYVKSTTVTNPPTPSVPYCPNSQSTGFVITKRLKIYGGFFGDETGGPNTRHGDALRTVLDGDLLHNDAGHPPYWYTDNAYHVVSIIGVQGLSGQPGVILDRFVIQDGYAVNTNSQNLYGGGVYASCSDLDIVGCTFQTNSAGYGGGVAFFGCHNIIPDLYTSRLHIKQTIFSTNNAIYSNGTTTPGAGGGLYANIASGELGNVQFLQNTAGTEGGGGGL